MKYSPICMEFALTFFFFLMYSVGKLSGNRNIFSHTGRGYQVWKICSHEVWSAHILIKERKNKECMQVRQYYIVQNGQKRYGDSHRGIGVKLWLKSMQTYACITNEMASWWIRSMMKEAWAMVKYIKKKETEHNRLAVFCHCLFAHSSGLLRHGCIAAGLQKVGTRKGLLLVLESIFPLMLYRTIDLFVYRVPRNSYPLQTHIFMRYVTWVRMRWHNIATLSQCLGIKSFRLL